MFIYYEYELFVNFIYANTYSHPNFYAFYDEYITILINIILFYGYHLGNQVKKPLSPSPALIYFPLLSSHTDLLFYLEIQPIWNGLLYIL